MSNKQKTRSKGKTVSKIKNRRYIKHAEIPKRKYYVSAFDIVLSAEKRKKVEVVSGTNSKAQAIQMVSRLRKNNNRYTYVSVSQSKPRKDSKFMIRWKRPSQILS